MGDSVTTVRKHVLNLKYVVDVIGLKTLIECLRELRVGLAALEKYTR